jgi:tetratricopeptide (TPR) repeat protein
MKKTLRFIAIAALLAVCIPVFAQMLAKVHGTAKDENGKPIVGARVEYYSKESGRKYNVTTDKKGEWFSIGITPGTYDVTLYVNNKEVTNAKGYQVSFNKEQNELDFDLAADRKRAESQLTEEQKKQMETATKEREKVKGLNEMLAKAKAASDAGQYDEAVTIMQQATQADPTRDLLWFRLGEALRLAAGKTTEKDARNQKYVDSVAAYKKAIEIKPTVGAYYNNMGESLAKSGDTKGAIEAYQQAASNDPSSAAQYYFNLGAVLTNSGKVDEATAAFDKAIAADPNKADAYYQKSINMMAKGTVDASGATHYPPEVAQGLQKYLELEPEGAHAADAKALLTGLGEKVETNFGNRKAKTVKK